MQAPSAPGTLVSREGDWLDRLGLPRARTPITRILCLKLDHIGDLLVADFAFRVLRDAFPLAHITLLCGSWNVGLAHRLGHSDRVIAVDFLRQDGADHADPERTAARRRESVRRLQELELGSFDLAIDLRIEEDTRPLLQLFDARIRAGIGHLSKFPFLDVASPPCEENLNQGADQVVLLSRDFPEGVGIAVGPYGLGFQTRRSWIGLTVTVSGAKTPVECGTSLYDTRRLGIGLYSAALTGRGEAGDQLVLASFAAGSAETAFLKKGWAEPESWGTWTIDETAYLSLPAGRRLDHEELTVRLAFRAHTNEGNAQLQVVIADPETGAQVHQLCDSHSQDYVVELNSSLQARAGRARSRPLAMKAGLWRASTRLFAGRSAPWEGLRMAVLGTRPERVVSERILTIPTGATGQIESECEFQVVDSTEPLQIEFSATDPGSVVDLFVASTTLRCAEPVPAKLPADHMEHRLAQLAFSVAAQFASRYAVMKRIPERILAAPSEQVDAALAETRSRLQGLRARGQVLVGVGIGANKETKRWPLPHFVELCKQILEHDDRLIVLCIGGPKEHAESELLIAATKPERVINLCGRTPLESLGEILATMDLYIGCDTGVTHYAGKLGTRTFSIFGATHHPREWGPVGWNSSWIMASPACSPCYLTDLADCHFGHACMINLRPEDCWAAIRPHLDAVLLAQDIAAAQANPAEPVSEPPQEGAGTAATRPVSPRQSTRSQTQSGVSAPGLQPGSAASRGRRERPARAVRARLPG